MGQTFQGYFKRESQEKARPGAQQEPRGHQDRGGKRERRKRKREEEKGKGEGKKGKEGGKGKEGRGNVAEEGIRKKILKSRRHFCLLRAVNFSLHSFDFFVSCAPAINRKQRGAGGRRKSKKKVAKR